MARDFLSDHEAEAEKLATRMAQLNRQFNHLFELCFERPDLAYDKWTKASENDAHAHEILKYQLYALGEMPQGEARKDRAVDASLQIAQVFQEYRLLRDRLETLRVIEPEQFKGMQWQMRADGDPWWVTRTPRDVPSDGPEPERNPERDWWRER